jgi:N-acetylmuramoyl-L-alanine amidase
MIPAARTRGSNDPVPAGARWPCGSLGRVESYEAKVGDCFYSISARKGFRQSGTLYDDAANAQLRSERPDRGELLPGDVVAIPDNQRRVEPASTGRRTTFFALLPERTLVRLTISYRAKLNYRLTTDVGSPVEGVTDGSAPIEAPVSRTATTATLELWPADQSPTGVIGAAVLYTIQIDLGQLSPLDTIRGVQGRLLNLGHYHGKLDGLLTDETKAAIRSFRASQGVPASDALDDELRSLLKKVHDG